MSFDFDAYLATKGRQALIKPSEAYLATKAGQADTTAPSDASAYASPYRSEGPKFPWWIQLELARRGLTTDVAQPVAQAVGAPLNLFSHVVGDRASNFVSGVGEGLFGHPGERTAELDRLPLTERLLRRAREWPIVQDPGAALEQTAQYVGQGVGAHPHPPPGLPAHGSSYQWIRNQGVPPTAALISDLVATTGPFELAGLAGRGVVSPALQAVGRTAEPLRQLPVIQQVISQTGKTGAAVRAYTPTRTAAEVGGTLPPWLTQFGLDVTDPKYGKYILGQIPSAREKMRDLVRLGAGTGALLGSRQADIEPLFHKAMTSIAQRYGIDNGEASNMIRDAIEEMPRNPNWGQNFTAAERQGIEATKDYLEYERQAGGVIGVRDTQLGSRIDRRARIAEARNARVGRADQAIQNEEQWLQGLGGHPGPIEGVELGHLQAGRDLEAEKLQDALAKFEKTSWMALPKDPNTGLYDVPASLQIIKDRGQNLVGYAPRSTGDEYSRYLGSTGRIQQGSGGASTGLGQERVTDPTKSTAQLEQIMGNADEWKNFQDPSRPMGEQLKDLGRTVAGIPQEERHVWDPFVDEMVKHGAERPRAIGHAYFVRDVLNSPEFASADPAMAQKGWIKLSRGTELKKRADVSGILSGFNQDVQDRLGNLYVRPDAYRYLEQLQAPIAANADRGIAQILPTINRIYKPMVTLVRPEFWERNAAWSLYVQTGHGNWNPRNYIAGARIAFRDSPTQLTYLGKRYGSKTEEEIRDLFIRHRIIGSGQGQILKTGGFNKLGDAYQSTEDALRASYAYYLLVDKGYTLNEAAKLVGQTMINYGPETQTQLDRFMSSQLVPFWGWSRGIYPLTARDLVEHPGAIGRMGQLQDIGFNNVRNLTDEQKQEIRKDPYAMERFGFPTHYDPRTDALTMANLGAIGYTDPGATFALRPGRYSPAIGPLESPVQSMAQQAGPALNLGYSLMSGKKNYSGGAVKGMEELPAWAGAIPGIQKESGYPVGPGWLNLLMRSVGSAPNLPVSANDPSLEAQELVRKYLLGDPRATSKLHDMIVSHALATKRVVSDAKKGIVGERVLENRLQENRAFQDQMNPDSTIQGDYLDSYLQRKGLH